MRPVGMMLLLFAFALLLPGCRKLDVFRRAESSRSLASGPQVGVPVPEIDAETLDGKRLKLSDHRGKVVVVAFWFSSCVPCMEMVEHERALIERHKGKPFVLLGVNADTNVNTAKKVIAAKKMTWPIWPIDACDPPIDQVWKVKSYPGIFVIDHEGVLRFANVRGEALDAAVDKLLAGAR